jgi:NADP-dependent 3-hydroxy acid dehydrogenase YdfG
LETGANVAVGARRADRLADLAKRAPVEVLALELDVTDDQSCRAAVAATVEHFGTLDVLVNNAGLMPSGLILGADTTEWTRMVRTNLLGTMYATHAALPPTPACPRGSRRAAPATHPTGRPSRAATSAAAPTTPH